MDNSYLDLGINKSGFVHTLHSGRLNSTIKICSLSSPWMVSWKETMMPSVTYNVIQYP
jgi:hypothetical protein